MWRMAAVFAATATLAVSGCSAGSDSGSSESTSAASGPSREKVDAIANTVPEDIKSSGKLIVGVNIPYAPNEFKDPSGKIVGFDVDLMNAVAATLGLTAEYREADFAKIIPSIQGDTFNVGMSSFTDTKEREQTVDFVTYFSAGILWAQRPGSRRPEQRVRQEGGGAGHHDRGDRRAARQEQGVHRRGQAGDRHHQVRRPGRRHQRRGARPGRRDVGGFAGDRCTRSSRATASWRPAGEIADAAPYGWPVKKGSPLAQSLKQALEHLIENGKYKEIATNWGVESGMIDKPVINGAIN